MGQQLVSVKSKAGSSFVGLVQVHALIPRHNKLGILRRICQGGAAQCTAVRIQLYFRIVLGGQSVTLSKGS